MAISKKSSHFFGPLLENGSDFVKCQNSSPVSGTSISHLIWVLDYLASCCWAYVDPEGIKNDLCRLHMRVYIIYRGGGIFQGRKWLCISKDCTNCFDQSRIRIWK